MAETQVVNVKFKLILLNVRGIRDLSVSKRSYSFLDKKTKGRYHLSPGGV